MTVYLAHAPRILSNGSIPDLSEAARFGNIATILEAGEAPGLNPEFAKRRIRERLTHFDPRVDHILWVNGDPLALMLIAFELLSQGTSDFSWLRYSRKLDESGNRTGESQYFPTRICLGHFLSESDARPPL